MVMMFMLLSAGLVFIDQLTKFAVLRRMHQSESIPVIHNVFHLTLVYNTGSAFGVLREQNWILIYASIIAIIGIIFVLLHRPRVYCGKYLYLWHYGLLSILSGATGNLIDRLRLGYVVDFLDFRIWPVFNVADSLITCGVGVLLFLVFQKEELKD
ncbi:MAG: signal peptidase II [Candidatus Omnitrophica bacterium]|jgi:lipoprotein signal peptidase|nr:signal peptidase II [Candidatus Omnitrophota bacterium]